MIIERDIGKPIIFAIDEIQSFTATYGDVIMPYSIKDSQNDFDWNSNNTPKKLYPLNHCLQQCIIDFGLKGVFSGTTFSYKDIEGFRV